MKKKLFFLWALLMASMQLMASHSTHYGKVVVSTTANGTVYIGTSNTATSGKMEETWNCNGSSGNDTKTYYLFAESNDGYYFTGWNGDGSANNSPYQISVKAESTDSNKPTIKNYTATFAPIPTHYSQVVVKVAGTGGAVCVNTTDAEAEYGTEKSANANTKVVEAPSHTYYIKAKVTDGYVFDGWYTNEECTQGKTTDLSRIVTITAASTTEGSPTTSTYYAKFVRTYTYYSKAGAKAIGNGQVSVSENTIPGEYGSEKELSKDETATSAPNHTYYLHAKATPGNTFVGWYTDEACTSEKSQDNPLKLDIEGTTDELVANVLYAKFNNGEDYTSRIVNPGAEAGSASGWVGEIGILSNGHQHSGTYLFETAGWGKNNGSMTQTISNLPNGYYKVSAWYIAATETSVQVHGNNVSSVAGQGIGDSQWNQLTTDFVTVKDGTLTIKGTSATTAGQNWANFDDFALTYYGPLTLDEAYEALDAALDECKPWDGASYATYTTIKSAYEGETYTTEDQINTAISELKAAYDTFRWDNASMEHPYDCTSLIPEADCTTQEGWYIIAGRTQESGKHWSGDASRKYFTQNTDGTTRGRDVTMGRAGIYLLRTTAMLTGDNRSYVEISVGDVTNKVSGNHGTTGGCVNMDGTEGTDNLANNGNGYGWFFNDITFVATENEVKNIKIGMGNGNNSYSWSAVGGMFLYYVGNKGTLTEEGSIITGMGCFDNEGITAKDNTTTIDLTGASGSFTIDATANPNVLVYTKGATVNGVTNNIVKNGTCANLVLTDGHPFKAHKNFTANNASYEMTAIAGDKFGTLMLPFAVSSLPGKAYTLDQGVNFGEEIHATKVNSITANKPVLVTAAGDYTASNVSVAATEDTYNNGELVGTYKATTAPVNSYVLQKHDTRVAFFLVKDVQPTVNPFRAYIKAQSAGVKALNIVFDDEETGIESLTTDNGQQTTVYDLSGRKVSKAQKGVYIINGKKVLK